MTLFTTDLIYDIEFYRSFNHVYTVIFREIYTFLAEGILYFMFHCTWRLVH